MRAAVSVAILIFNDLFGAGPEAEITKPLISSLAIAGLIVNVPYYLAAQGSRWPRTQAYARMLGDVLAMTLGLYAAGGLAAAQYIGIYTIVPVYVAVVFSSMACIVAAAVATLSFLAVAILQHSGSLVMTRTPLDDAWTIAAFNLLVLNLVGVLAAVLATAYRGSRRSLAAAHRELENAHDESVRLNAELQRSARLNALGEVVAGVAHEIRNALQIAFGHVWLLRHRAAGLSPAILGHVDQIEWSRDSAMRIVKNALDMARQASSERAAVSIPDLARRVMELKAYDLRRAGIGLRVDFPSAFPAVTAAPLELQQVLLNLVSNAQDAVSGVDGLRVITIVGLVDDGAAVFEVHATGPGIPSALLPCIFEPFRTTKAEGTGLRLSISVGIVSRLRGQITASNAPEGGAVFRVRLPAADQPVNSTTQPEIPYAPSLSGCA